MYENLGIHWASSIPAFLALACLPFPFLFYKYGEGIRMKCKFSSEAAKVLEYMRASHVTVDEEEDTTDEGEKAIEGISEKLADKTREAMTETRGLSMDLVEEAVVSTVEDKRLEAQSG